MQERGFFKVRKRVILCAPVMLRRLFFDGGVWLGRGTPERWLTEIWIAARRDRGLSICFDRRGIQQSTKGYGLIVLFEI